MHRRFTLFLFFCSCSLLVQGRVSRCNDGVLDEGDICYSAQILGVVGDGPGSIAAADFNRDGLLDLATANFNSNDITILLNQGGGVFSPQAPFFAGQGPQSLVAGDLNNDGAVDLTVLSNGEIRFFLNGGQGEMISQDVSFFANAGIAIAVADLDNNGFAEVVTALVSPFNKVSILRNVFLPGGPEPAPDEFEVGEFPFALSIADLNLDGFLDIVTANQVSNDLSVLLNQGNSSDATLPLFVRTANLQAGLAPTGVAIDDFNRDGLPDIAASNANSFDVTIALNQGGGAFAAQGGIPVEGGNPLGVFSADPDQDGVLDLFVLAGHSLGVLVGFEDGTFSFSHSLLLPGERDAASLVIGPFVNETPTDIAVASFEFNDITLLVTTP